MTPQHLRFLKPYISRFVNIFHFPRHPCPYTYSMELSVMTNVRPFASDICTKLAGIVSYKERGTRTVDGITFIFVQGAHQQEKDFHGRNPIYSGMRSNEPLYFTLVVHNTQYSLLGLLRRLCTPPASTQCSGNQLPLAVATSATVF